MIYKAKRAAKNRRRKARRATETFQRQYFCLKAQEVRRLETIRGRKTFRELRKARRATQVMRENASLLTRTLEMIKEFVAGNAEAKT